MMNEPAGLLTFVGPDGNIWLMRSDGGGKRRLTSSSVPEDGFTCPRWSPDGGAISFVQASTGALYVALAPDFQSHQRCRASALMAAYGPGYGQLTVLEVNSTRDTCAIQVVDVHGGGSRSLGSVPIAPEAQAPASHPMSEALRPYADGLAWSADRRYLALSWSPYLRGHGYLLDVQDGQLRPLGGLPELGDRPLRLGSLAFGGDASLLACVESGSMVGVALITVAGRVELRRGAPGHAATWGPQGRSIYYVGRPAANPSLWRVPARGGIPEEVLEGKLTIMPKDYYQNCLFWGLPSFAPSGEAFVVDQVQAEGRFGSDEYQAIETIWRASADGRESRMLAMGRQAAWQPAG